MKRLFLGIIILFLAQSFKAQTSLTIIGTMHNPIGQINANAILDALKKISPDVLLLELDSSLMDSTGKVLYSFKSNENEAVSEYEKIHSFIKRPIDFKDRNKYYKDNNTFELEDKFSAAIDSIYKAGKMDPSSQTFYETYKRINKVLNVFDRSDLVTINKPTTSALMELRQDMSLNGFVKICTDTPGLTAFKDARQKEADFWIVRTNAMTQNILKYITQFKDKKIVVLVGYYHKYALMNNLKKEQANYGFTIKEFWEY